MRDTIVLALIVLAREVFNKFTVEPRPISIEMRKYRTVSVGIFLANKPTLTFTSTL